MTGNIAIPTAKIAAFCRRHHIRRLSLFGSVLRDDFTPESDVDVLVDFEPGHTPGWEFMSMGDELTEIIGRGVDLHTPASSQPVFPGPGSWRSRGAVCRDMT